MWPKPKWPKVLGLAMPPMHGVGKTSSKSCVEAVCKGWRGSWHVVNVVDHGRRCDRGLWRLWPELGRRSLRGLLHLRREVLGRVLQWRWDAPASSSGQLFVILLFVALNFLPTFLDDEVACIFCHLNALWLCLGQVCTHVADTEMFLHRWQRHRNFWATECSLSRNRPSASAAERTISMKRWKLLQPETGCYILRPNQS